MNLFPGVKTMSGFRRDRNIKIPTRGKKTQPSSTNYMPSRPAEGRKDIPKKEENKPQPQRSNNRNNRPAQSRNRRSDNRRSNNQKPQRQKVVKPTPLDDEIWA